MAEIKRIDHERPAAALADLLNGSSRRCPVVVVTTAAGQDEPWIDAAEIARYAGDLAEVFLLRTGACTWEFSHRMPEGTQVYGGAGRAYPVGHEWTSDLTKSPIRFASNAADGEPATQHLISDALRMAAAAGLLQSLPTKARSRVSGPVQGVRVGRAFVKVGNGMFATVAEELTVEDVPIERLVTEGQQVEGRLDPETRRIDVTGSLRPAGDALAPYAVGDVVLAKVATVRSDKAELVLYPKTSTPAVTVAVLRADAATDPADDLRALMTVGEVLPARVAATGPEWALVLNDVDAGEPIVDAPALLPGGPPWLVEEADEPEPELEEEEQPPALLMPIAAPEPAPEPMAEKPVVPAPAVPVPARPSPVLLDRNRPRPCPPPRPSPTEVVQHTESVSSLRLRIEALTAEVGDLRSGRQGLGHQLLAAAAERRQLGCLLDEAERRAVRAENDLKTARARLRKAGNAKSGSAPGGGPQFADREQAFRYQVLTRWATRIPLSEQADRPLPDYVIGPRFLDTLDKLEGISTQKVADVVVEIVTELAPQSVGREVHKRRTGTGAGDPPLIRADGAVGWRASLQVKAPSARRIHYWMLPTNQYELATVGIHDDFDL